MVALALNTGLLPLTKRATTAKKTVRRTVAPKVRRSLLFLASTLSSRDERTNGWMDAHNLFRARARFSFSTPWTRPTPRVVGFAFPRRSPVAGRRRASVRVVVSLRSRRRSRVGAREGNETTTTTDPRAIDRSVDRSIVPLGRCERCERCERTNERRGRTNDGARSLDRSHRRTHTRTRGRTDGTVVVVRSGRPNHPHAPPVGSGRVESPVAGRDPW